MAKTNTPKVTQKQLNDRGLFQYKVAEDGTVVLRVSPVTGLPIQTSPAPALGPAMAALKTTKRSGK